MSLVQSVRRSLEAAPLTDADEAAKELALFYAAALDDEGNVFLGPQLLAVLEALGLTPRARKAIGREVDRGPAVSPLDELRQRRNARSAS